MTSTAEASCIRTAYRPRHPLDLRRILSPLNRGMGDPTTRWTESGFWRTFRTPLGDATLRIVQTADGVEACAWGDGADWVIDGVPELLGAGDDWSELDVSANPFLADALHRSPGLRLTRTRLVIDSLVPAILEQKVTTKQAFSSWRVLVNKYGTDAPGPAPQGLKVAPSAEAWKKVPSWEWHKAGVGPQRADTIMRATAVAAGLERTIALGRGGPQVAARLRSVHGVGIWTAAETSQRSHGDADAVSVGDYHLPATVGWALAGKPVDDDGMLELLAPWAGQRQRVMRLIGASGFRKPRFGPRITIEDHRRR